MLTTEQKHKTLDPDEFIPPAPHYPYWSLFCPICEQWWESELYRYHFCVTCPDCQDNSLQAS